jgi:hypothetical protein
VEIEYPTLLSDQSAPHLRAHPPATVVGLLGEALAATFGRRQTHLPTGVPLGLSDEFASDAIKQTQWKAFLAKNRLEVATLGDVVQQIRRFVSEPLRLAAERTES